MSNKILGMLLCVCGIIYLFFGMSFLNITYKVSSLYEESTINFYQPFLSYVLTTSMIIFGIINLLLAMSQFTKFNLKYRKISLMFLILSSSILVFFLVALLYTTLIPIYSLTSQF